MDNPHEVFGPAYDAWLVTRALDDLNKFQGALPKECIEGLRESQQLLMKILNKGENNEPESPEIA